jgi:hypothetical protein
MRLLRLAPAAAAARGASAQRVPAPGSLAPIPVVADTTYGFVVNVSGAAGTATVEQLSPLGAVLARVTQTLSDTGSLGTFQTVIGASPPARASRRWASDWRPAYQ